MIIFSLCVCTCVEICRQLQVSFLQLNPPFSVFFPFLSFFFLSSSSPSLWKRISLAWRSLSRLDWLSLSPRLVLISVSPRVEIVGLSLDPSAYGASIYRLSYLPSHIHGSFMVFIFTYFVTC